VAEVIDPLKLKPFPSLLTAAGVLGIGRNQAYRMAREGKFPVPVHDVNGRYKVSKYDLLRYLRVPGYFDPEKIGGAA
jgi:hypothetical protein